MAEATRLRQIEISVNEGVDNGFIEIFRLQANTESTQTYGLAYGVLFHSLADRLYVISNGY